MARYNSKKSMSTRDAVSRWLIVLACVIAAVALLPHIKEQTYSVRIDHPWYSHELVAPFEFPLLKSDAVLAAEQDSVRHTFAPYFRRDAEVRVNMMNEWRKRSAQLVADGEIDKAVAAYATKCLQTIYERGVMQTADYENLFVAQGMQMLSLITDKTFEVAYTDQIFTAKTAYQYVTASADSTQYSLLAMQQALQKIDMSAFIQPNLVYEEKRSNDALAERLADILPTAGRVMKGTRIVDRGEVVTEDVALKIRSLNAEMKRRDSTISEGYMSIVGQILYALVVVLGFVAYLIMFRFDYVVSMRHVWLLGMLIAVMPVVTSLTVRFSVFNIYVIPYAVIPIVARVFTDSRTAAMTLLVSVLLCALPLNQPFDFIVIQTVAGMVAIYSLRELSERSQLFRCALYVTSAALLARLSVDLIHEGDIEGIGWLYYVSLVMGGVLMLFAYPLLFMIERSLGFTSNVTLVELSNMNSQLLRRLSEEAPGTFQHCLQVANLSAEVANAIGAKSQLVRTGALYHDIGKLGHPAFFTENQQGVNPHDRLTPRQSARVILSHVTNGIELAEKHNLPKIIIDFIATHHGTGKASFFYIRERENHPGEEVDPQPFTYPGPNPTTLEQAILMMSDAVEAASRSLREYTDDTIAALVDKIVDGQVASGAFQLCPITFRDIATAKKVFKDKLRTIYHTRISYPDLK